jgi:hypothetical protein
MPCSDPCVRIPHMSKIFISYRRQDSRDITGRIYDRLLRHWEAERIFKDVDNIDPGEDYRDVIDREIARCSLFLAVIGPSWLDAKRADGKRRLDDANDMVRIEIETALKQNQRVIPVLVGESRMPEAEELPSSLLELADRHAFPVRPDPDFHRDMDRLVKLIERAMTSSEPMLAELIDPPAPQPVPPPLSLGQFAAQPAAAAAPPSVGYDSSPSYSGSRAPATAHAGLLFWVATSLVAVCLAGILFMLMALLGSVLPSTDGLSDPEDPDTNVMVRVMCVVAIFGNLCGLAAAACIYFRKLYWGALIATCAMALFTLLPCPVLHVPAAIFALVALLRPGISDAFDTA